eukprot:TRINITY_DN1862_c0_g1_i1.p1 TRINITY_DN1862_c0_g1~~TRINITY_DN1862_c0_g1_i1.p1  ORF type:complete len:141 (-),score=36.67 TRINITY_DN1862_c0_g1_i1:238-660(-)
MADSNEVVHNEQVVMKGPEALAKAVELIVSFGLPGGLLPLEDVVESGYNPETGFVWIKQKKAITHQFKLAGKLVSYGTEVQAFLEKGRLRKLTGVKAKEFLLWVPIGDIAVDDPPTDKIHFKAFAGVTRTFNVQAFAPGQ